jgi:hypothetical protein
VSEERILRRFLNKEGNMGMMFEDIYENKELRNFMPVL